MASINLTSLEVAKDFCSLEFAVKDDLIDHSQESRIHSIGFFFARRLESVPAAICSVAFIIAETVHAIFAGFRGSLHLGGLLTHLFLKELPLLKLDFLVSEGHDQALIDDWLWAKDSGLKVWHSVYALGVSLISPVRGVRRLHENKVRISPTLAIQDSLKELEKLSNRISSQIEPATPTARLAGFEEELVDAFNSVEQKRPELLRLQVLDVLREEHDRAFETHLAALEKVRQAIHNPSPEQWNGRLQEIRRKAIESEECIATETPLEAEMRDFHRQLEEKLSDLRQYAAERRVDGDLLQETLEALERALEHFDTLRD